MKRFMTETFFVPLKVSEELGMTSVKDKDGKEKIFKTRKLSRNTAGKTNVST